MFAADGGVFDFGDAQYVGSLPGSGITPDQPVSAAVSAPVGQGYWLTTSDGGVFTFGAAVFTGSLAEHGAAARIVSMSATPSGVGYWIYSADGQVSPFGDARSFGQYVGPLNQPIVFGASTTTSDGYWLFAADGGVFNYGDAPFLGSLGDTHLVSPIVGGIGF
jgi:hypothetical protein